MVFRIGDKKLTGLDKNVWTQKTKAGGTDLCTSGHKKLSKDCYTVCLPFANATQPLLHLY